MSKPTRYWSFDRPDLEMAKQIVCAIVLKSGGRFRGKTRLNKVFWWAHVYHRKFKNGFLSGYPIARLPEGPAIESLDQLISELERENKIVASVEPKGPYWEEVFTLAHQAEVSLTREELDSIQKAVVWADNKTAVYISQESHRLSLGWQAGNDGEIIDIALDAVDDQGARDSSIEVNRVTRLVEENSAIVGRVFGA